MSTMIDASFWQVSLPIAVFGAICIVLFPTLKRFHDFLQSTAKQRAVTCGIHRTATANVTRQRGFSDEDLFQLEKRAFLSKTWLFVCHKSRFEKVGDYQSFDVGGLAFFVVRGKDDQLRAFQNVCRHRAYTVVRKECGNSTRFSCRYHGWQYDDQGKLVKAPKFEKFPGFKLEENGLFEVKLITTRDGLVYVNFDAITLHLPFNNVESGLDMEAYNWLDGVLVETDANWKNIGNEFLDHAQWSRVPFGWVYPRKNKAVRLLGPLSIAKDLDSDLWCTMTLLPVSVSKSRVRVDLYSKPGHEVEPKNVQKWKWMLEQEVRAIERNTGTDLRSASFSYECGGRMIDLSAILEQHQRSEMLSKRKLFPAIRVTGFEEADREAAALCDAIENIALENVPDLSPCTRIPSLTRRSEW